MNWNIPGTVLVMEKQDAAQIEEQFTAMFLPGGMMPSQVSRITGLEPYTIQNWVKRGFLSPPDKKRYSLTQLCRIININMLRSVLSLDRICSLLAYVNGQLDDESDDVIDDASLYFMFVQLAVRAREMTSEEKRDQILDEAMKSYAEPVPGAGFRVRQVLRVMLTAWVSAQIGQEADDMLSSLLSGDTL